MTKPTIFILTGTESSGKTTLAKQLSDVLQAPLATEIARKYLEKKQNSSHYGLNDLLAIAKLQHSQEIKLHRHSGQYIISDTDLLVLIIWSEAKFGCCDPWLQNTFETALSGPLARHYFLCDWNIPWQPDPLRENPEGRETLYNIYLKKLQHYQLDYSLLTGDQVQRLDSALELCQKNILL